MLFFFLLNSLVSFSLASYTFSTAVVPSDFPSISSSKTMAGITQMDSSKLVPKCYSLKQDAKTCGTQLVNCGYQTVACGTMAITNGIKCGFSIHCGRRRRLGSVNGSGRRLFKFGKRFKKVTKTVVKKVTKCWKSPKTCNVTKYCKEVKKCSQAATCPIRTATCAAQLSNLAHGTQKFFEGTVMNGVKNVAQKIGKTVESWAAQAWDAVQNIYTWLKQWAQLYKYYELLEDIKEDIVPCVKSVGLNIATFIGQLLNLAKVRGQHFSESSVGNLFGLGTCIASYASTRTVYVQESNLTQTQLSTRRRLRMLLSSSTFKTFGVSFGVSASSFTEDTEGLGVSFSIMLTFLIANLNKQSHAQVQLAFCPTMSTNFEPDAGVEVGISFGKDLSEGGIGSVETAIAFGMDFDVLSHSFSLEVEFGKGLQFSKIGVSMTVNESEGEGEVSIGMKTCFAWLLSKYSTALTSTSTTTQQLQQLQLKQGVELEENSNALISNNDVEITEKNIQSNNYLMIGGASVMIFGLIGGMIKFIMKKGNFITNDVNYDELVTQV